MKLFFRAEGEGRPLLVLHGMFGSADNWQTHAKTLSQYFKVYLIDQRNHGHSPHSDDFSYDLMAEDLYELVAEEGLRDLLIIGHSMGGKTALRFAQQYGFLIDRMIIADMGIKAYPPHHDAVFAGLFAVDVENCESRKDAELRLSKHLSDESTKQFLLKNLYWKEQGKLAWRFNLDAIFRQRTEMMKALPDERIDNEVLLLRGGKSKYVLDDDMQAIEAMIPRVEFDTIENAGHWLHAEAPVVFIERCMRYFGE